MMPEKDPHSWQIVFGLFSPELKAAFFSIFMAYLRILYENKEQKRLRKLLESLMCGGLTYAAASGLTYFSLPPGVSLFVGGMISLMGVDYVREKAKSIFDKRVEKDAVVSVPFVAVTPTVPSLGPTTPSVRAGHVNVQVAPAPAKLVTVTVPLSPSVMVRPVGVNAPLKTIVEVAPPTSWSMLLIVTAPPPPPLATI